MKRMLGLLLIMGMQCNFLSAGDNFDEIEKRKQEVMSSGRTGIAILRSFDTAWAQRQNDRLSFFDEYPEYPHDALNTVKSFVFAYSMVSKMGCLVVPQDINDLLKECQPFIDKSDGQWQQYQDARVVAESTLDGKKWCGLKGSIRKYFGCCMKSNFPRKKEQ